MKIEAKYQAANKYAMSHLAHTEHRLTGQFGMGLAELALLECGKTTYRLLGHRARFAVTMVPGKPENYLDPVIMEVAPELVKAAEECLRANISKEELLAYIEKKGVMNRATQSEPVPPKLTKAQQQVKDIIEKINAATTNEEKIALVNEHSVFTVRLYKNLMRVQTSSTISKSAYNKCRKMAGGTYLKTISFEAEVTKQNIFDLIDISMKTNKVGQEKLNKNKKERLQRKYSSSSKGSSNVDGPNSSSFGAWYDDADMPMKINGEWVDMETGFKFSDY